MMIRTLFRGLTLEQKIENLKALPHQTLATTNLLEYWTGRQKAEDERKKDA